MVGLEEADVLGKPIEHFVPPSMVRGLSDMRQRLIAEKRLRGVTMSMLDAKGKERVIEINVWLLERNGRPSGALAVARDLTPQARLEEEMRETRLRLQRIIESSADGIVTTDREGNLTMFSRGAEEMFGYAAAEVLNKPIANFLASPEPGVEPLFRSIFAGGGRTTSYEMAVRARDGREVVVSVSASVLRDESAATVGYLGICKDITAARRAEEDLRQKNQELEAYVRTVSHDLRGPLVAVKGFCSLLEETCGAQLPEAGRYFLDRVKENARQMDRLISELLDLSTAGQAVGARYWVPAETVLRGIAADMAPLLESSGLRVEIQEPIPQVLGEETRLRQVFANLIDNAAKHLGRPEGGLIEVSAEPAERGHVFCVADNGVGIAPDLHGRIFEMFYTSPTNGEERGFGLGLPIVRKIVDAHGGRVWVESEPGRGARFYVHFPETKA
jgi:PAS domain S-box-containing protein